MKHVKKVAVMATVVGTVGMASVAWASWSADAIGSGGAKAAAKANVGVAAGTASTLLYPGANGDVVITITNLNPYKVTVSDVYNTGGSITSDTACDTAGNGVSFRAGWDLANAQGLTGATVAANGGTLTITVVGGVAMTNASDSACAGKSFTVPVGVHAASADPSASVATAKTVTIP